MPFFYFFLFQAVDCLLNRTCVSDVVEKGIRVPTVEDSGADTSLGLASERKPKAPLSAPPGASKPSQNNDVDIIDNEETPGLFEDWVPRSLNYKAGYLSKIVDYDDWEIVPEIFQLLDSRWGPHTVDCFATFYNFKVPESFLGSGIQVHLAWTHFFKPGKAKTVSRPPF